MKIRKINRRRSRSPKYQNFMWSFHVVVSQMTAKKCTKIYNARAQLLFCLLNLLIGDVLVAIAVLDCLSSLIGSLSNVGLRKRWFPYDSLSTSWENLIHIKIGCIFLSFTTIICITDILMYVKNP